jgi:hypothetical protein
VVAQTSASDLNACTSGHLRQCVPFPPVADTRDFLQPGICLPDLEVHCKPITCQLRYTRCLRSSLHSGNLACGLNRGTSHVGVFVSVVQPASHSEGLQAEPRSHTIALILLLSLIWFICSKSHSLCISSSSKHTSWSNRCLCN